MVGGSGRRRLAVLGGFALAVVGVVSGVAPAPAGGSRGGPPPQVLERDMRGEQAIDALGDRLPEVAALNDLTAREFEAALRSDSMLWVSRSGRLLFVDDFGGHDHDEAPIAHDALDSSAVPSEAEIFALHSRPGADRVIVLDFDGHDARGTAWGDTSAQIAGAYDFEGGPGTFTLAERTEIYGVWQRVAEDYAAFDVDVTTQDPGHGPGSTGHPSIRRDDADDVAFGTRVVVTPSKPYDCNCGGVAYVGVYDEIGATHDHYQPAWVFTEGVGHGAKHVAEAVSHEAGHNLGLSHDGTRRSGYYTGHGDWAPIMGVGYYEPITQWSRGEYSGANNKEDDFAVIQANGGPLAIDDWPGVAELAGPVTGVIGTRTDVDSFSFTLSLGGAVVLSAAPATVSPNLDIGLTVTDGSGTVVASADPSSEPSSGNDVSLGLDAVIDTTLPAGSYAVHVDGVGWGDPGSTGYSDYASVGRYRLTASITDDGGTPPGDDDGGSTGPTSPPPAPTDVAGSPTGTTVTVTWSDNSSGDSQESGFEVVREFRHRNGSWRGTTLIATTEADATSITDSPGSGTFRYGVRAVNDVGVSGYSYSPAVTVGSSGPKSAR